MKLKKLMTFFSGLCVLTITVGCLLLTLKGNTFMVAASIDLMVYIMLMITSIIMMLKDKNLYIPKQNETISSARMVLLVTALAVAVLIVSLVAAFLK